MSGILVVSCRKLKKNSGQESQGDNQIPSACFILSFLVEFKMMKIDYYLFLKPIQCSTNFQIFIKIDAPVQKIHYFQNFLLCTAQKIQQKAYTVLKFLTGKFVHNAILFFNKLIIFFFILYISKQISSPYKFQLKYFSFYFIKIG